MHIFGLVCIRRDAFPSFIQITVGIANCRLITTVVFLTEYMGGAFLFLVFIEILEGLYSSACIHVYLVEKPLFAYSRSALPVNLFVML